MMKLIADAGSTKTDWRLVNNEGIIIGSFESGGMNPIVFDDETLKLNLANSGELFDFSENIGEVHFYGAGTDEPMAQHRLQLILQEVFEKADINIYNDLLASARSTAGREPGLVAILGTGSNSGYYDGEKIVKTVGHFGYVLMDDASGNWFGRQLIRDYYFERMPLRLRKIFKQKFNLNEDYLKTHIYQSAKPNAFLASYSIFMHENYDERYIKKLLYNGFRQFLEQEMHAYHQYKEELPLHFTGSIAYFYQRELKEAVKDTGWRLGTILRKPLETLVKFHI